MFLNQISVVDHAYIDDKGHVVGGSFNPDFIVSGDIDPVEQVVVDFSTVKKDLKRFIDHKEFGFDHKLWFIVGYSLGTFEQHMVDGEWYYSIITPTFRAKLPANAVKVFTATEYTLESIGSAFEDYLQVHMESLYPSIKIVCNNTTIAHTNNSIASGQNGVLPVAQSQPSYFTYVHGLKDSTSWGCQNNSHGHLSFIQLEPANADTLLLQQSIASVLDGVVFIKRENIDRTEGSWVHIDYTTERGHFYAAYDASQIKVVILDTETTIEHLVSHVAEAFGDDIKALGVTRVFVSEGLSKGAIVEITNNI